MRWVKRGGWTGSVARGARQGFLAYLKNLRILQVVAKTYPFSFETYGLTIWHGTPPVMRRLHSHTEVEMNLITRGTLTYRFAGEPVVLKAGALHVFGGIIPHVLEQVTPKAEYVCLTLPLADFIRWQLPENISGPILRGEILSDSDWVHDVRRFARWWDDIEGGDARRTRATLPELQARLERMALSNELATTWKRRITGAAGVAVPGVLQRIEQMLHTLSARFSEPLTLKELAAGTGWHTHYAAEQFKRWIGVSPGQFLLRQRISHARYLLATDGTKVLEVSEACGFGSQSSFYAAFTKLAGMTPAAYRRKIGSHGATSRSAL